MKQDKKMMSLVMILLMTGMMGACSREAEPPAPAPLVGGDRDEHGCIGSAGYSWCAKRSECVQPWEVAKQEGFEVDERAFNDYCGNSPQ